MYKCNHGSSLNVLHSTVLVVLALLLCTAMPAAGQSMPSQDNDTRGWQIANMDQFLDSHAEIAEQLRKDPSLIKNEEFVENHPELQKYLQEHPGIREEFSENPRAFMRQEERFDGRENEAGNRPAVDRDDRTVGRDRDITREELVNMDRFLDSHPEISEQLRKDPSLIKNKEFVEKHPELREFLQTHPGVREEFSENPNAFMHREEQFDRREDENGRRPTTDRDDRNFGRDRDLTRGELANMDRFLDGHPEIAEQLHKDPSLIKNHEFVEKHPALQEFLQTHPEVREEFRENPNAFMRQEQRFDAGEDSRNREMRFPDQDRGHFASFGQFLGGHSTLAQQLSKDPSLANNKEFLASHVELREYLKAHPEVQEELAKNPQAVVNSATRPSSITPVNPTLQPKHKQ